MTQQKLRMIINFFHNKTCQLDKVSTVTSILNNKIIINRPKLNLIKYLKELGDLTNNLNGKFLTTKEI